MRRYLVMILAVLLFGTGIPWAAEGSTLVRYQYDRLNRLTKAVYSDCTGVSYVYDAAGNRLMRNLGKEEEGDLNGRACITLDDAIIALQILSGVESGKESIRPDYAVSRADVNDNGRVDVAEAIFILQWLAGIR